MTDVAPHRGDIWLADAGEPVGHEAGYERPVLVISAGRFNAFRLVTICPITRSEKLWPTRVSIDPGTSGLSTKSFIQAEQVRTISTRRLLKHLGRAEAAQMFDVERVLRLLFELR